MTCKKFEDRNGDRIGVEPEPGTGSAFPLPIPFVPQSVRSKQQPYFSEVGRGSIRPIQPLTSGNIRQSHAHGYDPAELNSYGNAEVILLVEDEDALRRVTRRILQRYGYQVIEAANGVEALELWDRFRDDIVLLFTDLVMPGGIHGRQLSERLKAEKPELKVLLTSGYNADFLQRHEYLKDGEWFLEKPYSPDKLTETVHRSLSSDS